MKVLHLPHNIASQIDTHVRILRDVGVDARGLVWDSSPIHSYTEAVQHYGPVQGRRRPIRKRLRMCAWYRAVLAGIRWADIVHWRFGYAGKESLPWNADLRYLAATGKPRLIDFCGSDIRIPEVAAVDNIHAAEAYSRGEMPQGSKEESHATQERFSRHGFDCILRRYELIPYLRKDLFPDFLMTPTPLILEDFPPNYPDPKNDRPVIVHCPSRLGAKGTAVVLAAIETLKGRWEFDFQLVHGVPRHECLDIMRKSDIMIDQMVIGEYGNAALEAMAFGKPTVCYVKPAVASQSPDDFPIVNANQENLVSVLERLLEDGTRRAEVGRRSRDYVERHHAGSVVARQLVTIYERLLERKQQPGDQVK